MYCIPLLLFITLSHNPNISALTWKRQKEGKIWSPYSQLFYCEGFEDIAEVTQCSRRILSSSLFSQILLEKVKEKKSCEVYSILNENFNMAIHEYLLKIIPLGVLHINVFALTKMVCVNC